MWSLNAKLLLYVFVFTLLFSVCELLAGVSARSLLLVEESVHMFADSVSFGISLWAEVRTANGNSQCANLFGAGVSLATLSFTMVAVFVESVRRLVHLHDHGVVVNSSTMLIFGLVLCTFHLTCLALYYCGFSVHSHGHSHGGVAHEAHDEHYDCLEKPVNGHDAQGCSGGHFGHDAHAHSHGHSHGPAGHGHGAHGHSHGHGHAHGRSHAPVADSAVEAQHGADSCCQGASSDAHVERNRASSASSRRRGRSRTGSAADGVYVEMALAGDHVGENPTLGGLTISSSGDHEGPTDSIGRAHSHGHHHGVSGCGQSADGHKHDKCSHNPVGSEELEASILFGTPAALEPSHGHAPKHAEGHACAHGGSHGHSHSCCGIDHSSLNMASAVFHIFIDFLHSFFVVVTALVLRAIGPDSPLSGTIDAVASLALACIIGGGVLVLGKAFWTQLRSYCSRGYDSFPPGGDSAVVDEGLADRLAVT